MIPVLTPEQMNEVDRAAPESVDVLIERAGWAVAHEALSMLGGGYGKRVVVIAGRGNNGRDGLVAARSLRRRGVRVDIVAPDEEIDRRRQYDLIIDAAYGTGLSSEYFAPDVLGADVLAVDIPSGLDGLDGSVRGSALHASRTVTFAAAKPGMITGEGPSLCGDIVVADIGLDVAHATAHIVEAGDVRHAIPRRRTDAHKWSSAVWVVAGSTEFPGAAHLAAAAAMRSGAGYVRVSSPNSAGGSLPIEAVRFPVSGPGWASAVLEGSQRFSSLLVGPGLGRATSTSAGVDQLLDESAIPMVVDADALWVLGQSPRKLTPLDSEGTGAARPRIVLTPHDGEFAHLRPGLSPMGASPSDRVGETIELAEAYNAVVVRKGPTTIVSDPDGRTRFVTSGDQRLATAGTGDVLAGIICALIARGMDLFDAASIGSVVHATAAATLEPTGLAASDLLAAIPGALGGARAASESADEA